jgi:outer membrane protein assembly factor BamD (BamD/ComL family)
MQLLRRIQQFCALCLLTEALLWCSLPALAQADQEEPPSTRLYAFGLQLFRLGDYYSALTELKRFTLLYPQHERYEAAQILMGLALQEDGLYDDAFSHFQRLYQIENDTDVGQVAAFKLGEIRFLQQQHRQAIDYLQHFLQAFPEGPLAPQTTYLLGLSWALDGQRAQAQRVLTAFPPQHALSEQALALQHALQTEPLSTPKSPRLAGILAGILPGAGHLYAGQPQHALTAFLLNGCFLTGAAFAFHEGLVAVGAILLYFETGWYLGNINSAVDAARSVNRQQPSAFADQLRATYAPPPLTLQRLQTPGLGLRFTF